MVAANAPVAMCGADQSPYNVRPPRSNWPVPNVPVEADWTASPDVARTFRKDLAVCHLVNAAQCLYRNGSLHDEKDQGSDAKIHDISVGYGPRATHRMLVYCKDPPGAVEFVPNSGEDDTILDDIDVADDIMGERERDHYVELLQRLHSKRERERALVAQLASLSSRGNLSATELKLRPYDNYLSTSPIPTTSDYYHYLSTSLYHLTSNHSLSYIFLLRCTTTLAGRHPEVQLVRNASRNCVCSAGRTPPRSAGVRYTR